jgi:hypothetical protein
MGPRYSRRRVLATTASLASVGTLAGCSSSGDSDGGDGTEEGSGGSTSSGETSTAAGAGVDGDADPTETATAADDDGGGSDGAQQLCADLTDTEYERYDESGSPFVATFEYPINGDGSAVGGTGIAGEEYSVSLQKQLGDADSFYIFAVQYTNGTDAPTAVQRGEGRGLEQVGSLQFGGESVPVIRAEPEATGDSRNRVYNREPYYILGLPHEADSGTQYYRFDLRATTAFANGIDTNDCQESWEEVATHMVNSLEANADTTVESAGE